MVNRRPIATALLCSFLLHLLVAVSAWFWLPATRPGKVAGDEHVLRVSLAGIPAPPEPALRLAAAEVAAPPPPELSPPPPAPAPDVTPNLNPAPQLREAFTVPMATLLPSPPSPPQLRGLQSALNSVSDRLPQWIGSAGMDAAGPLHWRDGGRDYEITVERLRPAGPMDLELALVTVTTEQDGLSLRAQLPFRRVAFSHFAQMVNRWDPEVSLAGDTIIGRFHSNSSLAVDVASGPRVTGRATVAGRVKMSGRGDRAGVFPSGLETGAPRIPLPRRPFDPALIEQAAGSLHRIGVDARIRFRGDGSYEWWVAGAARGARVLPDRLPWLIVAEGDAELSVEGEVNGSFLVYSRRKISITGNLRYALDPRRARSDDVLGLVCDGNVEVAAPGITGPGDLEVFAAIYAGRQFRVRGYRHGNGGRLDIHGSVTAGSLTATEPRFTTRLEFDRRLADQRPPWFPVTNRYEAGSGDIRWTVESIAASR